MNEECLKKLENFAKETRKMCIRDRRGGEGFAGAEISGH